MPEPGEGPLHNPPPPVSPQFPSVLMGCPPVVGAGWDDRLDAPTRQACPQRVAVIAAIGNQPFRALTGSPGFPWSPDGNGVGGLFEGRDLRRGCRVQVCSQRSTRAIDQNHPLRTLAPLGIADPGPIFRRDEAPIRKAFVPAQFLLVIRVHSD
jgi:hypothetical protein